MNVSLSQLKRNNNLKEEGECEESSKSQAQTSNSPLCPIKEEASPKDISNGKKSKRIPLSKQKNSKPTNSKKKTEKELSKFSKKTEENKISGSSEPKINKKGKKKQKYGSFTRRLWNNDEDEAITSLVDKYGIRRWTLISKKLQEEYGINGRSGKQCRER